jgi:hypothetical protein
LFEFIAFISFLFGLICYQIDFLHIFIKSNSSDDFNAIFGVFFYFLSSKFIFEHYLKKEIIIFDYLILLVLQLVITLIFTFISVFYNIDCILLFMVAFNFFVNYMIYKKL